MIKPQGNSHDYQNDADGLTPEQRRQLIKIANAWGRMENWCAINRSIGKIFIIGGLGLLIMLGGAFDAIKNLLGWRP